MSASHQLPSQCLELVSKTPVAYTAWHRAQDGVLVNGRRARASNLFHALRAPARHRHIFLTPERAERPLVKVTPLRVKIMPNLYFSERALTRLTEEPRLATERRDTELAITLWHEKASELGSPPPVEAFDL
jgi:hypothetical protein